MGIFRTLSPPVPSISAFLKTFHGIFQKIDHILDYEPNLKKFCETSIILTTFSEQQENF